MARTKIETDDGTEIVVTMKPPQLKLSRNEEEYIHMFWSGEKEWWQIQVINDVGGETIVGGGAFTGQEIQDIYEFVAQNASKVQ